MNKNNISLKIYFHEENWFFSGASYNIVYIYFFLTSGRIFNGFLPPPHLYNVGLRTGEEQILKVIKALSTDLACKELNS